MISELLQKIIDSAQESMEKSLEHLGTSLNTVRAGRATPAMVENVNVEYYGSSTPLSQVASVSAPQPDMLIVQPWDKTALNDIEKAITAANLGLNPGNDGDFIRIPVPPLSEDRRKDLVKAAKSMGEEAKVAIRNVRRQAKDDIKKVQKEESLPEDQRFEGEEQLQKITDSNIDRIDKALDRKEKDIMEV